MGIDVLSKDVDRFPPPEWFKRRAHIGSMEEYHRLYRRAVEDPEGFWAEMAEALTWVKRWEKVVEYDFHSPYVRWFIGGRLNASYNCLDRFIDSPTRNKAALIWESDEGQYRTLTYQQLFHEVNRFANVLRRRGIGKGDRVTIYLPMIPELPVAMLACARIGAIHNVVFGGFSANSLRERVLDSGSKLLITADEGIRGGKVVPLKANADEALEGCPSVERVIVVKRTGSPVNMKPSRDSYWDEEISASEVENYCEPAVVEATDPLFILYTSGSTGKPKGIVHSTGGYLLYTHLTFKWIFDYHDEDIHFCTADIGWITGHSYIVYGPLSCGATSLMFEGTPTYPHPGRYWEIVDKHRVNIFYTAPTVIRALMREGERWVEGYNLSTLRLLGTVGEPINPEAWLWYYRYVGRERLPIVDTWWQTETGGILITPLPGAMTLKPGSANKPFPGVVPKVLREDGTEAETNEGGYLTVERPWPGMFMGLFGDRDGRRTKEVYFSRFPGYYFTGDGARVDEEGDYWLMGRIDDVLNVSGHRLGTAEIESALVAHDAVAEAAVVGFPHEIKGEGIHTFVVLKEGINPSEGLRRELILHVRKVIGPIATPDRVQFCRGLPKTRSGKIMRRVLKRIARGEREDLGDLTTLADPGVIDDLIKGEEGH